MNFWDRERGLVYSDPVGRHGLIAGGDYLEPENPEHNIARSTDGGRTWETIPGPPPGGHRAAITWIPGEESTTWLAVGRAGTDLSTDDGRSWQPLSEEGFYAVSVAVDGAVWAAGSEGRVARLMWEAPFCSDLPASGGLGPG